MNIAGFDLNLLRVFHALMTERHVTRAGKRVGLSQPAVSSALNRLRAVFGDELFVRTSGAMVPTPRALALAEPIADAMRRIESMLGSAQHFDALAERREFRLMGSDYVGYLLVPLVMADLGRTAPGIGLRVLDAQGGRVAELLEEGRIDLAVEVMHELADSVRSQLLLRERYVVIAGAGNMEIAEGSGPRGVIDLDLYCRLPHVLHSLVGGASGNVDASLAAVNRRRQVALSLPHFLSIAKAVAESQMIATFPERLALHLAPMLGLSLREPPVELAPISLAMIWHRRNDGDAGHMWLRSRIMEAAQGLD